jgi:hypothetical protein
LREALEKAQIRALEKKHRAGYERHPVRREEFSISEGEQVWTEP